MRLGRRVAKFLIWSLVVLAAILGGAAWFAYALVTDSDTAARLIKAHAAKFLPGALLEMGKPNIRLLVGEVKIKDIALRQRIDGEPFVTARIPWLSLRLDARQLLHGRFQPREIDVSHPTLRLCRRKDKTWNLQGLLASPLPVMSIQDPPPIVIRNGTVELVGDEEAEPGPKLLGATAMRPIPARMAGMDPEVVRTREPAAPPRALAAGAVAAAERSQAKASPVSGASAGQGVAILRDVTLRVEAAEGGRFHFEGTAHGDLFDRLILEGSIDPATGDVTLTGELAGLTLSEHLRRRLPAEVAAGVRRPGAEPGRDRPRVRPPGVPPQGPAGAAVRLRRRRPGSTAGSGNAPRCPSRSTTCRPPSPSARGC